MDFLSPKKDIDRYFISTHGERVEDVIKTRTTKNVAWFRVPEDTYIISFSEEGNPTDANCGMMLIKYLIKYGIHFLKDFVIALETYRNDIYDVTYRQLEKDTKFATEIFDVFINCDKIIYDDFRTKVKIYFNKVEFSDLYEGKKPFGIQIHLPGDVMANYYLGMSENEMSMLETYSTEKYINKDLSIRDRIRFFNTVREDLYWKVSEDKLDKIQPKKTIPEIVEFDDDHEVVIDRLGIYRILCGKRCTFRRLSRFDEDLLNPKNNPTLKDVIDSFGNDPKLVIYTGCKVDYTNPTYIYEKKNKSIRQIETPGKLQSYISLAKGLIPFTPKKRPRSFTPSPKSEKK